MFDTLLIDMKMLVHYLVMILRAIISFLDHLEIHCSNLMVFLLFVKIFICE